MFSHVFDVGTCAHFIAEIIGNQQAQRASKDQIKDPAAIVRAATRLLLAVGSPNEAIPHPISPDAVLEGRDLAVRVMDKYPCKIGAQIECAVAFDKKWKQVDWDAKDARFRLVYDRVERGQNIDPYDDDAPGFDFWEATDYKTSWAADGKLLDGIQMRAQAIALSKLYGGRDDVECVRQTILNMRSLETFSRDLWVLSKDSELDGWQADVEDMLAGYDAQAKGGRARPARPGPNCLGCSYVTMCDEARETYEGMGMEPDLIEMARQYAVANAKAEALQKVLKSCIKDGARAVVEGQELAMHAKESSVVTAAQAERIYGEFSEGGAGPLDFLVAIGGIGKTQLDKAARVMFPEDRDIRGAWIDSHHSKKIGSVFGFKPVAASNEQREAEAVAVTGTEAATN